MGAALNYLTYEINDRDKIARSFADESEASRHESGNSYSGEIGMLRGNIEWRNKQFPSVQEADAFLADAHEKWTGPMAVSFFLPTKSSETKRKKQGERVTAARKKVQQLKETIFKTFKDAKSDFAGCRNPNCKSKIRRSFLRFGYGESPASCPVCQKSLLSDTAKTKIANAMVKLQTEVDKINAIQSDSKEIGWLVGGWCSS